jgi:predicted NBD/HSP70 family sugar kinase
VTPGTVVGALDIGGTHVSAGLVHLGSTSIERRVRLPFAADASRAELLEAITTAAGDIATPETTRFGVAVPGPFDYAAGISTIRHKLAALHGVDLRVALASALGLDPGAVRFLNDAGSFLLGEWWAGAARGHTRAVGITLGTGLGAAFLLDGRLVQSDAVPAGGELYTLTFRGAPVERTISRSAVLGHYGADPEAGLDVEGIAARARRGERRARLVFEQFAADLAEFLGPPLAAFAPTCLIVGGSIAHAWSLLEPGLRAGLATCRQLVVARAASIEDAALLGAGWYVAKEGGNGAFGPAG